MVLRCAVAALSAVASCCVLCCAPGFSLPSLPAVLSRALLCVLCRAAFHLVVVCCSLWVLRFVFSALSGVAGVVFLAGVPSGVPVSC